MSEQVEKSIEVRGFLHLDAAFRKKHGKIPLIMDLDSPITGRELAEKLEIPWDEIEVIFVNGFVQDLDYVIHPGDRVAFLPPGCPGPYRIALGFYGKNQNNEANFRIKKK
ncbi:Mut7-C ubiquitin [Geosporobacter subterraneus DSM 17957]|uniref:Mut7-C ubiquitin n=1 Tax=Geosporobacter subterraneus DSM 17957 TaxID=1121919 RepID=A0A1M6EHQ8_9FIRM|nr:MoaD/ThiS family protein [Geosporobacter subterraneus]SHI84973.1 Mut7-C ubiquitin [Geosporobacter subterraneus DSM 17957]